MRAVALLVSLILCAAAPAAAQTGEQDLQIGGAETFRRALDELRTTMLRTGERVEGWDQGGANPDADLRAAGADTHYFLNRGSDGASVGIITNRAITEFAPERWRIVDSYGSSAVRLPGAQLDFIALSPRYAIATRTQYRRRGGVDCTEGITNALLYEVPGAEARPNDETVPILFRLLMLALEGQEICVRSEGDRESGYRSRTFLPDGRPLPELSDAEDLTTIVPAAPIERLIAPPPPAATPST